LDSVLYAQTLGFRPVTTPAYSPESNGMAEAFVNTVKRDYIHGADLSDGETVIRQLPGWIDDYNRIAPHSFLGMRSPKEFRALNPQISCV
jgi:transposase InsO family protein